MDKEMVLYYINLKMEILEELMEFYADSDAYTYNHGKFEAYKNCHKDMKDILTKVKGEL